MMDVQTDPHILDQAILRAHSLTPFPTNIDTHISVPHLLSPLVRSPLCSFRNHTPFAPHTCSSLHAPPHSLFSACFATRSPSHPQDRDTAPVHESSLRACPPVLPLSLARPRTSTHPTLPQLGSHTSTGDKDDGGGSDEVGCVGI